MSSVPDDFLRRFFTNHRISAVKDDLRTCILKNCSAVFDKATRILKFTADVLHKVVLCIVKADKERLFNGTEFKFKKGENGTLILSPSKKVPDSIEELFKNWHGKYEVSDEMRDWDEMKPKGKEIW